MRRPDFLDTEDGKALLLGVSGRRDPLAATSTERHSPRARSWRDCGRDGEACVAGGSVCGDQAE